MTSQHRVKRIVQGNDADFAEWPWQLSLRKRAGTTVDGKGGLSNNFSVISPSFVHLLAIKPMVKQSRASGQLSGQLSGGHWVESRIS